MVKGGWARLESCGCCGARRARPFGEIEGVGLLRCGQCGTVRFEAVAPPDVIYSDGYHTGSGDYGWNYADQDELGCRTALADETLAWIERRRSPGRLIDVGGGLGYFAATAARHGWDAELLEPVSEAVDHARQEFGLRATLGTVEELKNRPNEFDLICFLHCIEHIPPARETLAMAGEALAPRGLLFIEVPNLGSLSRRMEGQSWYGWRAGEHAYVFSRRSLVGLVRRAGFEPVAVRTYVPGWSGLLPDAYAHFLGLQRIMARVLSVKRRLDGTGNGSGPSDHRPVPIREHRGIRRAVYGRGFELAKSFEELVGLGTNVQLLARPLMSTSNRQSRPRSEGGS